MSYDLTLTPHRLGDEFHQLTNPFTGKPSPEPCRLPRMNDEELAAATEVLRRAGITEIGDSLLELDDGGRAEIVFDESLRDGLNICVRCLSAQLTKLVFAVMQSGAMVLWPGDASVELATAEGHLREDDSGIGQVVVRTVEELHAAMSDGFDDWQSYRDRVIR